MLADGKHALSVAIRTSKASRVSLPPLNRGAKSLRLLREGVGDVVAELGVGHHDLAKLGGVDQGREVSDDLEEGVAHAAVALARGLPNGERGGAEGHSVRGNLVAETSLIEVLAEGEDGLHGDDLEAIDFVLVRDGVDASMEGKATNGADGSKRGLCCPPKKKQKDASVSLKTFGVEGRK